MKNVIYHIVKNQLNNDIKWTKNELAKTTM